MSQPAPWISVSPHVSAALRAGRPVVAFESAVFSHGLPPQHVRPLVGRLDDIVRTSGAEPAVVAVVEGRVIVGVTAPRVAGLLRPGVLKVAERDLPVAIATGASGGTTVAATVAVAHAAGIRVMATGGIGGVHRSTADAMDISADLPALARHPLVVVCAGPKAVCDPRRTMEALDSLGVAVVGYRTSVLPGFLTRSSGVRLIHRVETPAAVARIAATARRMGIVSAILVVQAPPEDVALDETELNDAVAAATSIAEARAVEGPDVTPFLLRTIATVTGGRSLAANLAVLESNARLAAEVAVAWRRLDQGRGPHRVPSDPRSITPGRARGGRRESRAGRGRPTR